ncbi:865_t:CDS:2, partial [Scutellospora calospora]
SLQIYSGSIGAYLNTNEPPHWFHRSLIPASEWLKQNNYLIKQYHFNLITTPPTPVSMFPIPLPLARQSLQTNSFSNLHHSRLPDDTPRPPDLIVPNIQFPQEIHDQDSHHTRLIAASTPNSDGSNLPLLFNNPDLEALIFSDLFSNGKGHFENMKKRSNLQPSIDSYGKYIKLRMLCPDPRFRLHWYWPHWSYLTLEKKTSYNNHSIINESKTTMIPSYLSTAAPFFKKKQHQVNTMIQAY